MFVLGFSASPRLKGNSDYLLSVFMQQAKESGFETHTVSAVKTEYKPCIGCGQCEKKGVCSIQDGLDRHLFPLIRKADLIVLSTPVYFYGIPSRMKGIIDRMQTLWSRKYRFDLSDPGESYKKGVLLSVGATRGFTLFDGIRLTTRYFLDAVGAQYAGELCYSGVDARGAIKENKSLEEDVIALANKILTPLKNRKKIIFVCRENAGRSQMAAAFAKNFAGGRYEVLSAGSQPVDKVHPVVVEVMGEKGYDIAFNKPCSIEDALKSANGSVDMMVTMGCGEICPVIPGCEVIDWALFDPAGQSIDSVKIIRDEIEQRVRQLLCS